MSAGCGHVPLSTDAARQVITDQIAQLTKAAETLPEESAVREWLDNAVEYARRSLGLLDAMPMLPLREALGDHMREWRAIRSVMPGGALGAVAEDLWLALGGHVHVEQVTS